MNIKSWMPFYVGDYLRDTQHLTKAEHGSYVLTLLTYWANGESLPDRKFRLIAGKEFAVVSEFYSLEGNRWHHKRIDAELAKAEATYRATVERAQKGVAARRALGQLPKKEGEA